MALLTEKQLNTINISRSAIPGRLYYGTDGKTYQGNADRTLFVYQPAITSSFIPTKRIPDTTVQKAIERIGDTYITTAGALTTKEGIVAFPGGGQADAIILLDNINMVDTVATAGDSVRFPDNPKITIMWVYNNGANDMNLFPKFGSYFTVYNTDMAVNSPISIGAGNSRMFTLFDNGIWRTI